MSSASMPSNAAAIQPTSDTELDARVARVAARKDDWLSLGAPEKAAYLRRVLDGTLGIAERWVQVGCEIKGIAPGDPLEGEEWIAGPMPTVRNARLLIEALNAGR